MGNAPDQTVDKVFMQQTQQLMQNFSQDDPLFHAQEIKFPLYTDQMKIVDSTGRRVKLAGGNWSGGHMCRHCVDGLEFRKLRDIAMDIRFKFKMNCIRLTYSLQLIYDNNLIPQKYLRANPQLQGKTSMQVFDITVKTLTEVGLMVILNNHTSTSQWCCSNDDGDGLWWSRQYPEYMFFEHVQMFAKRYRDNERVIGMDMRNQIRKANGLQPSWGDGNAKTDWKRAAQISSQIALKHAPHWLILIGGLNYQLDLTGVKQNPIRLSVPRKLVYTGHFYGFSWPIPSWQVYSYDNFKKKLFNTQTYVRSLGVPYLLGQFGNNNQDIPWRYLMQYLGETGIDWTYWALDGFKCQPQKDQTYGVFTNDFSDARHPQMLLDMIRVGAPQSALASYQKYHILRRNNSTKKQNHQQKPVSLSYDDQVIPAHKVQSSNKVSSRPPLQDDQKQYKIGAKQNINTVGKNTQNVSSGGYINQNPNSSTNANFLLNQQKTSNEKSKQYFQQMNNYANQIYTSKQQGQTGNQFQNNPQQYNQYSYQNPRTPNQQFSQYAGQQTSQSYNERPGQSQYQGQPQGQYQGQFQGQYQGQPQGQYQGQGQNLGSNTSGGYQYGNQGGGQTRSTQYK